MAQLDDRIRPHEGHALHRESRLMIAAFAVAAIVPGCLILFVNSGFFGDAPALFDPIDLLSEQGAVKAAAVLGLAILGAVVYGLLMRDIELGTREREELLGKLSDALARSEDMKKRMDKIQH